MQSIFEQMVERWKSPIVARTQVSEFSGGVMTVKRLSNLDSLGEGPPRIRIGRKVCYPTRELAAWLEARSEVLKN